MREINRSMLDAFSRDFHADPNNAVRRNAEGTTSAQIVR